MKERMDLIAYISSINPESCITSIGFDVVRYHVKLNDEGEEEDVIRTRNHILPMKYTTVNHILNGTEYIIKDKIFQKDVLPKILAETIHTLNSKEDLMYIDVYSSLIHQQYRPPFNEDDFNYINGYMSSMNREKALFESMGISYTREAIIRVTPELVMNINESSNTEFILEMLN